MLQVLLRQQHALRTQASRHAAKSGLRRLSPLPYRIGRGLSCGRQLWQDDGVAHETEVANPVQYLIIHRDVPLFCPGCGAPSQTIEPTSAGYYGEKKQRQRGEKQKQEDAVFAAAFAGGGFDTPQPSVERPTLDKGTPICDRCHNLQYQSTGRPIIHPSTSSLRAIIEESPHRFNHIYHVLDAADFPMSLIPNLTGALHLPKLRTQNRRARAVRYVRDRVAEVNFIITRSDLVAPKKEQVDTLLPYFQEVLRDALGRTRQNVRLGNVRLVSAKRGWWTKTVKEEIWRRGGAGWMVGKVNVGKSALVEAIFPKGRMDKLNISKLRADALAEQATNEESKPAISPFIAKAPPTGEYKGHDLDPSLDIGVENEEGQPSTQEEPELGREEAEEEVTAFDALQRAEEDAMAVHAPQDAGADMAVYTSQGVDEEITAPHAPQDASRENMAVYTPQGAEVTAVDAPQDASGEVIAVYKPQGTDADVMAPYTAHDADADIEAPEDVDDPYIFDESELSLLPPKQPEVAYPVMPLVSALPGTTASPIRLPFGNGRGELIDLPGLQRSHLETYVKEESRKEMVMKYRIIPEQQSVKPGQSLILGGLIRITPKTEELVFLMYGFLPAALNPHVTSTEKAIAIQTGTFDTTGEAYEGGVHSNATDAAKLSIKSAGSYTLRWDVTKQRAGPVTSRVAGKQKPDTLPYIVYALDLLIEGVGWVEVVAQTRRKRIEQATRVDPRDPFREDAGSRPEPDLPEIEVFSPQGKFVGARRPMNGWLLGGPKKVAVHKQRKRPRHSMSYQRRVEGGRIGSLKKAAAAAAAA